MKYKYLFIGLVYCILFSSCEDYLTKEYKNGFVGESFMQTENQAKEAVTAIYDPLNWHGFYYLGSMCLGEAMSDNCENLWGDGNNGPDIVSLHNYQWSGANQYFVYRWNNAYTGITRANYVLSKINGVSGLSDAIKNQLTGEALFLRAFYYYSIVGGFGDVPLITTVLTVDEANVVKKTPEDQVWTQIITDLKDAIPLLPATYSASELGRATSGAANAFLSRVYLWTGEWQNSVDAANKVTGYSLVSTKQFPDMFNTLLEFSSESVFEVVHINDFGNVWNKQNAESTLLMHMSPMLNWGDYFHPRKVKKEDNGIADYDILDYFESGDIRRKGSILIPYVDTVTYNGVAGIFPDTEALQADSTKYPWRPNLVAGMVYQTRKFLLEDATKYRNTYNKFYSVNHPVIRFAEVILNKAEALVELNQLPDAVIEIQKIRSRAGLNDTIDGNIPSLPSITGSVKINTLNQTQLRELVRHERRIELMFETERWYDLKRWDALKTVLPAAGFSYDESRHKYWPIPTVEVEINPNLGK